MLRLICFVILMTFSALAQTETKAEFEVVSVKPSPPAQPGVPMNVGCNGGPGTTDPTTFRCTNMNLANLITAAYGIMRFQLTGPDWMQNQRFEISARVAGEPSREQLNLMLQNMLAGRFKLAVHRETKEMPRYELVVAKNGPKLKPSDTDPGPRSADPPDPSPPKMDKDMYPVLKPGQAGTIIINGRARTFRPNCTMQQFAQILSGQLGKPVVDSTGLSGRYDISFYWARETLTGGPGAEPSPGDPGPTLEQAIQDQLGLRLVSDRGPVEFIVVDRLEKLPSEN